VGMQFDDDSNTLPLKRFLAADAEMSRVLSWDMKAFVAFKNLTGTRCEISRNPVLTAGSPLLIRLGARGTSH
jgi:hypothetical protein